MDQRRIRRIFVNSKFLQKSLMIANSLNIFDDMKIFNLEWIIFIDKNCLTDSNLNKSPYSKTLHFVVKIEVQIFKKSTFFRFSQTILFRILLNFPKKSSKQFVTNLSAAASINEINTKNMFVYHWRYETKIYPTHIDYKEHSIPHYYMALYI